MWMNGNNASSIMHKDAFNQMNCLFNGTKKWKLIAWKYEKKIYKKRVYPPQFSGISKINVSAVDLIKYPLVAEVPWQYTVVNAGDCLFLPGSMYHQVMIWIILTKFLISEIMLFSIKGRVTTNALTKCLTEFQKTIQRPSAYLDIVAFVN